MFNSQSLGDLESLANFYGNQPASEDSQEKLFEVAIEAINRARLLVDVFQEELVSEC